MILFRYILLDFFKYVLGTVVVTVFLFVLFDFIHKTTSYFAEYKPPTDLIIKYYLFQLPNQIVQAIPIAAMLGSVISMIMLSRSNEITAMRAAGMGPGKIMKPLAVGGILLSIFCYWMGEVVVPRSSYKMHYIQDVLIEGEKDDALADGAHWYHDGSLYINFQEYDPLSQTLHGLKIFDLLPNFRPKQITEAESAIYLAEEGIWRLGKIKIFDFKRDGTIDSMRTQKFQNLSLPIEPQKLKKERRKPTEFSVKELAEEIRKRERSGAEVVSYKVEYHIKLAYPLAAFVISLIGLRFGYKSERVTETAKGVIIAFAIGLSYWFVLSACRALGIRGDMPPMLSAWMSNVVILSIILINIRQVSKI